MQPTTQPSVQPSSQPTAQPSRQPSSQPSRRPTGQPSSQPSFNLQDDVAPIDSFTAAAVDTASIAASLRLSNNINAVAYCASFAGQRNVSGPFSNDDVTRQGFSALAASRRATVTVTGLAPSTSYRVYCSTVSYGGAALSFEDVLATEVRVRTGCCKAVDVRLLTPEARTGQQLLGALSVAIDHQPWSQLVAAVNVTRLGPNATQTDTVATQVFAYPATATFVAAVASGPDASIELQQREARAMALFLSDASAGAYRITVDLRGPSASEYRVVYDGGAVSGGLLLTVQSAQSRDRVAAPKATAAVFSGDGGVVTVSFDRATNRAGFVNFFRCGLLLRFAGSQAAQCRWASSAAIEVTFPGGSGSSAPMLLTVNATVVVRGDAGIKVPCASAVNSSRSDVLCLLANSTVSTELMVLGPAVPDIPTVVMVAPSIVSPCSALQIDVSASRGDGGRPWTSHRFVVRNSRSFAVEALEDFLNEPGYVLIPASPVPASLLLPASTYTVELTLCNFLAACGKASLRIAVGNVTGGAFALQRPGASLLTVLPRVPLTVQTRPVLSACNSSADRVEVRTAAVTATVRWTVLAANGSALAVQSQSNDRFVFYLPPYSLAAGHQYTVVGSASIAAPVPRSASTSFVVVVQSDVIEATISGPATRTLPVGTSLRLDASSSLDRNLPRDRTGLSAGLRFQWSCVQLDPLPASADSGCTLVLTSWRAGTQTTSAAASAFAAGLAEVTNVSAPATALPDGRANVTVRVTVAVSSASRLATAAVDVTVVASLTPVPSVDLRLLHDGDARFFDVFQKLTLQGLVRVYEACNATWTVDDPAVRLDQVALTPVYAAVAGSDGTAGASAVSSRVYLSLRPGSLPGDASLAFRLQCGDVFAQVAVATNSPPRPGLFRVTPPAGTALRTMFQLLATQWTDAQPPLLYEFRYWAYTSRIFVTLRSFEASSQADSALPMGSEAALFQVPLQLRVADVLGAVSVAASNVSVGGSVNATQASHFAAAVARRLDVRDAPAARQQLSLLSAVLLQTNCSRVVALCPSLHREACSTVAQTCGGCLSGFVGDAGSANTMCVALGSVAAASAASPPFVVSAQRSGATAALSPSLAAAVADAPADAAPAVAPWRRLQGETNSSDATLAVPCRVVADCLAAAGLDSPWIYCNRRLRLCAVRSKACPTSCSSHGACEFRDLNSGASLGDCSVGDPQCEARCVCDAGYFGDSCDADLATWTALRRATSDAIAALFLLAGAEPASGPSVASWSQLLFSLTLDADRLGVGDVQRALLLADRVLSHFEQLQAAAQAALRDAADTRQIDAAAALSDADLSSLQLLLGALDHLAACDWLWDDATAADDASALPTAAWQPSANNSLVHSRGLLWLTQRQQDVVRRYQVVGEDAALTVLRHLRATMLAVPADRAAAPLNVSTPVTAAEAFAATLSPFGARAPRSLQTTVRFEWRATANSTLGAAAAAATNDTASADVVVALTEVRARAYRNRRVLHSNPLLLAVDFVASPQRFLAALLPTAAAGGEATILQDARSALAELLQTVSWSLPHHRRVDAYAADFVVRNLTTRCSGPGDEAVAELQCEDSGVFLRHNCSGRSGRLVSFCPKPIASCAALSSVWTRSQRVAFANASLTETLLERYAPLSLCALQRFSAAETQCRCAFETGLAANRSAQGRAEEYYYVYGQDAAAAERWPVRFLLDGARSVEAVVVNGYEPYRYADVFVESAGDPSLPVPWATLALFAPVWALLLLLGAAWRRFRRGDGDVGAQSKAAAKQPAAVAAAAAPAAGAADESPVVRSEDVFADYVALLAALLPDVFRPGAGDGGPSVWRVLWRQHRYLQLLRDLWRGGGGGGDDDDGDDDDDGGGSSSDARDERLAVWLGAWPASPPTQRATGRGAQWPLGALLGGRRVAKEPPAPQRRDEALATSLRSVRGLWRRTKASVALLTASLCALTVVAALLDAQFHARAQLCAAQTPDAATASFVLQQPGNWSTAQIAPALAQTLAAARGRCEAVRTLLDDAAARCRWQVFPDRLHVLRPTALQPARHHFECVAVRDASVLSAVALGHVAAAALMALWLVGWGVRHVLCWFDRRFLSFWLKRRGCPSPWLGRLYTAVPLRGDLARVAPRAHRAMAALFPSAALARTARHVTDGQRRADELLEVRVGDPQLGARVSAALSFLLKANGAAMRRALEVTEPQHAELARAAEDFCRRWDVLLAPATAPLVGRLWRSAAPAPSRAELYALRAQQRIALETRSAAFVRSLADRRGAAVGQSLVAVRAVVGAVMRDALGGDAAVAASVWTWQFARERPASIVSREAQHFAQHAKDWRHLRALQVAALAVAALLVGSVAGVVAVLARPAYADRHVLSVVSVRMVAVFFATLAADALVVATLQCVTLHVCLPLAVQPAVALASRRVLRLLATALQRLLLLRAGDVNEAQKRPYDVPPPSPLASCTALATGRSLLSSQHLLRWGFSDAHGRLRIGAGLDGDHEAAAAPPLQGLVGVTALLAATCAEAFALEAPCAAELMRVDADGDGPHEKGHAPWERRASALTEAAQLPPRPAALDLEGAARRAAQAADGDAVAFEATSERAGSARRRRPSFLMAWRRGSADLADDADAAEEFAALRPDGEGVLWRCAALVACLCVAGGSVVQRAAVGVRRLRTASHRVGLRIAHRLTSCAAARASGGCEAIVEGFWAVGCGLLLEAGVCGGRLGDGRAARVVCAAAVALLVPWLAVCLLLALVTVARRSFWSARLHSQAVAEARSLLRQRRFGHIERSVLGDVDPPAAADGDGDGDNDGDDGDVALHGDRESRWSLAQSDALRRLFAQFCSENGVDASWRQGEAAAHDELRAHLLQPLREVDEEEELSSDESDDESDDESGGESDDEAAEGDREGLRAAVAVDAKKVAGESREGGGDVAEGSDGDEATEPLHLPRSGRAQSARESSRSHRLRSTSADAGESKVDRPREPSARFPSIPAISSLGSFSLGSSRVTPLPQATTGASEGASGRSARLEPSGGDRSTDVVVMPAAPTLPPLALQLSPTAFGRRVAPQPTLTDEDPSAPRGQRSSANAAPGEAITGGSVAPAARHGPAVASAPSPLLPSPLPPLKPLPTLPYTPVSFAVVPSRGFAAFAGRGDGDSSRLVSRSDSKATADRRGRPFASAASAASPRSSKAKHRARLTPSRWLNGSDSSGRMGRAASSGGDSSGDGSVDGDSNAGDSSDSRSENGSDSDEHNGGGNSGSDSDSGSGDSDEDSGAETVTSASAGSDDDAVDAR